LRTAVLALGVFIAACASPQPRWKNVQVLPRNMPHDNLIAEMRSWDRALGVTCSYCHVEINKRNEFVSDEKPAKRITRDMLRMTRRVNSDTARLVKNPRTVTCDTCHRGKVAPEA